MVEKKNEKKIKTPRNDAKSRESYTINEVFKISDDLFNLSKEKDYPMGAFVHGLVFALELAQQSFHIPPQQLAEIKRDCRRYVDEIVRINGLKTAQK